MHTVIPEDLNEEPQSFTDKTEAVRYAATLKGHYYIYSEGEENNG